MPRPDTRDGRTLAREAYFLEFARDIASVARMPLMVTGGIRRRAVAEQVIDSGIAMAGIATALSIDPYLPRHWQAGRSDAPALRAITWKNKALGSLANMAVVKFQLRRLGEGRATNPRISPLMALLQQQLSNACQTRRYRRWTTRRATVR